MSNDAEPDRSDVSDEQLAGHVAYLGCSEAGEPMIGDAQIEWHDEAHAGPGWYMSCGEYPDEGSVFLSAKHEPFPALLKLLQAQSERDHDDEVAATPGEPVAGWG